MKSGAGEQQGGGGPSEPSAYPFVLGGTQGQAAPSGFGMIGSEI